MLASETHFADHLAPIYKALQEPGTFYTRPAFAEKHAIPGRWPLEATDRPILVASYGDLKVARRADRTRIALIEHGYGQTFSNDHPSYAGGMDRDDVSLFLIPNEHAAQRNRERNPDAQVEIVGCPKLDDLPKREGSGTTIAISFHFDAHAVASEARGTTHHYRKHLASLAQEFHVIGHGHPRALPVLGRFYKKAGIELVPDFSEVCRRADVYVCDYSSTIYEFASTGRPVVVLNAPWYRRNVSHGLRFWEAANVGVQVNQPDELPDAIRLALTDPPEQRGKREAALSMVYAYRSGAARRAAKVLEQWIGA
jgi:hypothetical protein